MRPGTFRSILTVGVIAALTSAFALHLRLVKSEPRDGQILTSMPTEIRLWFSQKPEQGLTTIKLLREDSTVVTSSKAVRTDDSLSVKAPLTEALVPGTYIVSWRSLSRDGHAVRGSYHFNMVPSQP